MLHQAMFSYAYDNVIENSAICHLWGILGAGGRQGKIGTGNWVTAKADQQLVY